MYIPLLVGDCVLSFYILVSLLLPTHLYFHLVFKMLCCSCVLMTHGTKKKKRQAGRNGKYDISLFTVLNRDIKQNSIILFKFFFLQRVNDMNLFIKKIRLGSPELNLHAITNELIHTLLQLMYV